MPAYVVDFHCHPSFKPNSNVGIRAGINMWDYIPAEAHLLAQLSKPIQKILAGIGLDSQSNLQEMKRGKVRGGFLAIHPIERGWLKHKSYSSHPIRDLLLRCALPKEVVWSQSLSLPPSGRLSSLEKSINT